MLRRSQDAALRRHFVVYTQNAALVTTTRTEGARVVLTLPVALKAAKGMGGSEQKKKRLLHTGVQFPEQTAASVERLWPRRLLPDYSMLFIVAR